MSTIQRRTDVVTIYPGDYLARIRHLERQAEASQAAEAGGGITLDEAPDYLEIAREHDELVKEADERATHIKLQALPRRQWKALCKKHPVRTVEKDDVTEKVAREDAAVGVNEETFKEALVFGDTVEIDGQMVPVRSIVEPALSTEELEELSDADFERVYLTAFALNRVTGGSPKASLVSRMTQKTDETSS